MMWEFPKIRGTFWGGLHIRDYSILGSIWGYPNFGKVPCSFKIITILGDLFAGCRLRFGLSFVWRPLNDNSLFCCVNIT